MNIIQLVSNKVWGGGERYALDLCKALRADGHKVEVFTRNVPTVRDVFAAEKLLKGTLRLGGILDVLSPVRLASYLNKADGDVTIHVHNFKDARTALIAQRLYKGPHRVKVVATRHLVRPAKTDAASRRTYNALDGIIFVSKLAMDVFLSTDPATDRTKLHVVHNSIVATPRTRISHPDNPARLIFAGRIVPEKGLGVLLEALGKLGGTGWRLSVCGTGREKDVMPLIDLAGRLGIGGLIDWKGHVNDVMAEMAQSDVAVLPSVWREPFGLTILESFSQGLPVITTDNGAQPEIMTDGKEGLLVAPDDADALASAIGKLIGDPALRRRMGEQAYETFNGKHNYSKFYNSVLAIYNGL